MKKNKNKKALAVDHNNQGIHGVPSKLKDEWRRLYDSKREKLSEGAKGAFSTQTVAHKDQWRNKNNNHKKAK